jgi:hypothetical protein
MGSLVNTVGIKDVYEANFGDFAVPTLEVAPSTTIVNRATVTRSLKAIAGIERIHVRSINLLQNEFGPNGERVFEADNKDARIRIVGNPAQFSTAEGTGISIAVSDFATFYEVTAYCTGLNILCASRLITLGVSVDGGSETSPISFTESGILQSRNYGQNQVINVSSGLTLGWHTFKIRKTGGSNPYINYGFEILNQRTDLAVYSGRGISKGITSQLDALTTSSFTESVTGTRGARVVKYVYGGQLASAVTMVDATAKYLTNADHTNEEFVRRINFREFGANRADDFSTLSTSSSSRAFTLDDGTTSLSSNPVAVQSAIAEKIYVTANAGFISLTFVGTGLDIVRIDTTTSSGVDTFSYSIDGTTIGTISGSGSQVQRIEKIVSGLPYGTHVFRLNRTSAPTTWDVGISDFIIYQPKKPTLPNGAFEVADYNVMANYVNSSNFTTESTSTGILRKTATREVVYTNTWSATLDTAFSSAGWLLSSSTATSSVTYTFWGTGVEWLFKTNASLAMNITVSINGSSNLSAFTTSYLPASTGTTFTASTGLISGTSAGQGFSKLSINGLTLGLNTIRVTQNAANNTCLHSSFDVITPIHINEPSLRSGSESLKSVTKYSPERSVSNAGADLSKAKAWIYFDGGSTTIYSSYNISAFLTVAAGNYRLYFEKPFKNDKYAVIASANGGTSKISTAGLTTRSPNVIQIQNTNDAGGLEHNSIAVAVFGELIDE